jgi:tRNA pseudouridine55 synthase
LSSPPDQRHGLLLLDKPAGRSSFQAIAAERRSLGRKVGHAGTLDPFATGLLLVLAGRATRLAPYLAGLEKRYEAGIRFGVQSTTDDPEGDLTATGGRTDAEAIAAALPALTGQIRQVPPAASAVHVDGERAYRRFRRGEAVTVPVREVDVHELILRGFDEATQTAGLAVRCGSGTYVRALARDLGAALGCGAYCATLRRTGIGPFSVDDAGRFLEPVDAVPHLPAMDVDAETAAAIRHGRRVPRTVAGPVRLVDAGRLVAIGVPDAAGIRPAVVFEP